ncbi:hypothetical protein [Ligilactobacillus sp.]
MTARLISSGKVGKIPAFFVHQGLKMPVIGALRKQKTNIAKKHRENV